MTRFSPLFPAAAFLLAISHPVWAEKAPPGITVRLLTVGNSFSHNATHYLGDLAKAAGDTLILHEANTGGATMEQHWNKAQQFEKDPQDPAGLYNTKRSLRQELTSEKWDFVTIQQASIKSHDLGTYRPYAQELRDYIKKYAPGAEVILHETWEYRNDDPRFSAKDAKPGEPLTQDAMYDGLSRSYATIASELGLRLIPVGDAFHEVNHDPGWAYHKDTSFDPKRAQYPALPNQTHSLNMGWQWKKNKEGKVTLQMDGHHANTAGEFLGACVFYEVLFHKRVVGHGFVPPGLQLSDAVYLQDVAHQVVQKNAAPQPGKS